MWLFTLLNILGKTFFCKNCIFWPRDIYLTFHQIGLDVPFSECLHQFWEGKTFLFHFHSIINHCWSPLSFTILHNKIFCHTLLILSRIYESTFAPVFTFFSHTLYNSHFNSHLNLYMQIYVCKFIFVCICDSVSCK